MRGVNLKKGEPVDRALKRLKSKLDSEGILEEMRRRRAFETPTERKATQASFRLQAQQGPLALQQRRPR